VTPNSAVVGLHDCWNRTGTLGDKSCSQLKQYNHCRNCPVYSKAGSQLLDRPLWPDYRQAWAARLAAGQELPSPGDTSVMLFRLGPEWLALPTAVFQEITERRRIHSLPHRRNGIILGLVNVRGELLLAVSLGHFLGLEEIPDEELLRTHFHRLVVAYYRGTRFAFPVDAVQGPHRFSHSNLKPPPGGVVRRSGTFAHGILQWQDHAVGVLAPDPLFTALNQKLA
jgi:chemotaxis-related protein WspD